MKKKLGSAFGVVILIAVLVVLVNSAFVIRENQYGLVREFGRIERVISDSGLYFKIPFIQERILSQRSYCSMILQSPMSLRRIKSQ